MPDIKTQLTHYLIIGLMAALVAVGLGGAWYKHSYDKRIADLQNEMAMKDKTIEIAKGLYTKLTVQTQTIQDTLDQKDEQVKSLLAQVKKKNQDLLTATTAVVTWKKAYEGLSNATETPVPPEPGQPATATRTKVDFHNDFGYIKVDGWTLTNPPQAWVRLTQGRPLRLTVALSQDKDKAWHTYATSSEENIGVDIQVSSVNPYVLQPKWYEKLGVAIDVGAGTNLNGVGALVGLGVNYQFMQFTLGPHVWLGINNTVDKYYGVSFEWRPFQRK